MVATMEALLGQLVTYQFSPEEQGEIVKHLQSLAQEGNDLKDVKLKNPRDISCVSHLCRLYKDQSCFDSYDFLVNVFPSSVAKELKNDCIVLCGSNANMVHYRELQRERSTKVTLLIDPDSVFQETVLAPHPQNHSVLTNFQDIKERISTAADYDTVSFQLPIFKKSMKTKAFAPYFPARHNDIPYFGDIGYTEQTLIFREGERFIDLYLANRDNHVVELGLVADVVVRVNHAQILKKRYVKATIFTTFDIIDYCPIFEFTSSMFRIDPVYGLGWYDDYPTTLLGSFENIPVGCVVGGPVFFRALFDLSVAVTKRENKPHLDVTMIIEVDDGFNQKFTVEIYCLDFLLDILGWSDARCREAVMQEVSEFDGITINFLKVSDRDLLQLKDSLRLVDKLVWLVHGHINFRLPLLLHLLCLKQPCRPGIKPYKVICFKNMTKMSRHPTVKL